MTIPAGARGDRYRAGKRLWSAADDAQLRLIYPDRPTATVARQLRRSLCAVYQRARAVLRVKKSAAYLASAEACRLRRGDHVGASFIFPKGHVRANKGLRRPGWAPGRMRETQFKKGQLAGGASAKWLPVGTEVVAPDGYRKRKVADRRDVPSRFNWTFVHVLVWVQAHGPVPAGHAIAFVNGDRADIRLDNLELITRRDLMARNSIHHLPEPLANTVMLLGALNRQIRKRDQYAE